MILEVNNKTFRFFKSFTIEKKFATLASTFQCSAKNELFDYFLEFPNCRVLDNAGNLIMTCKIVAPTITFDAKPNQIDYAGFTLPGVLEDCSIAKSSYPLQFDNLSLEQITKKIIQPFALTLSLQNGAAKDAKKKFEKSTVDPNTKIKQYLSELAAQRNIYITHNEFGDLVFTRINANTMIPRKSFEEGKPGLLNASISIQSQYLHSDITVLRQATNRNPDSSEYTMKNPYVTEFRPVTHIASAGDIFDVKTAARNALSDELSKIKIILSVTDYVEPGELIQLKSSTIHLNRFAQLFVDEVKYTEEDGKTDYYTLTCILPDVYSNDPVTKNIFKL